MTQCLCPLDLDLQANESKLSVHAMKKIVKLFNAFTLSISTWTDLSIDSSWTLSELCYVHSRNASADSDPVHLAFGHIKLEEDERMVSPTHSQQRRKS